MTNQELALLSMLGDCHDRGAFAMACDGQDRAKAHALEKLGLAQWRGTNWGSSFWSITDEGQKYLKKAP